MVCNDRSPTRCGEARLLYEVFFFVCLFRLYSVPLHLFYLSLGTSFFLSFSDGRVDRYIYLSLHIYLYRCIDFCMTTFFFRPLSYRWSLLYRFLFFCVVALGCCGRLL